MTKRTKRIYSKQIALKLRKKGFKIIRTEPNEKYPQYDVYIFQVEGDFENALDEIMESLL